jgi:hypothetical protein
MSVAKKKVNISPYQAVEAYRVVRCWVGIPQCVENRLRDGGVIFSLTRRPRSTPQIHYFSASGTHFS